MSFHGPSYRIIITWRYGQAFALRLHWLRSDVFSNKFRGPIAAFAGRVIVLAENTWQSPAIHPTRVWCGCLRLSLARDLCARAFGRCVASSLFLCSALLTPFFIFASCQTTASLLSIKLFSSYSYLFFLILSANLEQPTSFMKRSLPRFLSFRRSKRRLITSVSAPLIVMNYNDDQYKVSRGNEIRLWEMKGDAWLGKSNRNLNPSTLSPKSARNRVYRTFFVFHRWHE